MAAMKLAYYLSSSNSCVTAQGPPTAHRLVSASRRSFPVAAAILWNSLLFDVQSSTSLSFFQQRLKTFLFHKSFPGVLL